jgi:hypothetical protein
MSEDKAEGA